MNSSEEEAKGTIYSLVHNLVKHLFSQLPGTHKAKLTSLKKSLESIIDAYKHQNLASALDGGDYSHPPLHLIFKFNKRQ